MRALSRTLCLVWLLGCCARVSAQPAAAAPVPVEQAAPGPTPGLPPLRVPNEPGSSVHAPLPAAPPGTCIGGSCGNTLTPAELARAHPFGVPTYAFPGTSRGVPPRERFAYAGAVLGTVSAALILGGAIGIAVADDLGSERITRGIFLGYVAVSTPLVALSVWLARRESHMEGFKGLRRFGWLSYALAVSDGALMWSSAFRHEESPHLLTIAAGVFGALAILPHALEALNAARGIRSRRYRQQQVSLGGSGLTVRF